MGLPLHLKKQVSQQDKQAMLAMAKKQSLQSSQLQHNPRAEEWNVSFTAQMGNNYNYYNMNRKAHFFWLNIWFRVYEEFSSDEDGVYALNSSVVDPVINFLTIFL